MATVGQVLSAPESGWKRYEETDSAFTYLGTSWVSGTGAAYSGGTGKYTVTSTFHSVKFNFTGSKIRIISYRGTDRNSAITLKIDDVIYTYTANGSAQNTTLLFEKIDLIDAEHNAEISVSDATGQKIFEFDAIDIDVNKTVKQYKTFSYKTLVLSNGYYKKYVGNSWVTVSSAPTEADYLNNGMDDISIIPESAWSQLTGTVELYYYTDDSRKSEALFNIETNPFTLTNEWINNTPSVLYYTDDANVTNPTIDITTNYNPIDDLSDPELLVYGFGYSDLTKQLQVTGTVSPKLVMPIANLDIKGDIQSLTLNVSESGNGIVRLIASANNGVSWNYFRGSAWNVVDISDLNNVKTNGMSATELNAINASQWALLTTSRRIRLAYYIEEKYSSDLANINSLVSSENIYSVTPQFNGLTIVYDAIDSNYYGLLFMDISDSFYSTSMGDILKYLDLGTLVAGQTSLDVKVKIKNGYNFPVKDLVLSSSDNMDDVFVELSKTTNPFISQSILNYSQTLQPDDVIEFYIRISTSKTATSGGNFNISAKASPA